MNYKTFLRNIKILDDNYDFFKVINTSFFYHNNFIMSAFISNRNIDINNKNLDPEYVEIFLDFPNTDTFFIEEKVISVNNSFIRGLSYDDINMIDDVEYVLRYGRIKYNIPLIEIIPDMIGSFIDFYGEKK